RHAGFLAPPILRIPRLHISHLGRRPDASTDGRLAARVDVGLADGWSRRWRRGRRRSGWRQPSGRRRGRRRRWRWRFSVRDDVDSLLERPELQRDVAPYVLASTKRQLVLGDKPRHLRFNQI